MSEYNEKVCPICHELNDIDAENCYWCKYKFIDKSLETEHEYYCKYCHAPVVPDFPSEDKYGHSCTHCKIKKVLCTISFLLLASLVYALIVNIFRSFGIILGPIPVIIIASMLILSVKTGVTTVMEHTEKKPIYVKSTDESNQSITVSLDRTEDELHTKIIKSIISSGETKNIKVQIEHDSASVQFNNKQVGFLSEKDNEFINNFSSYAVTNIKIIHQKENDTYKIQLQVNLNCGENSTDIAIKEIPFKKTLESNVQHMDKNLENKKIEKPNKDRSSVTKKRYCKLCGGTIDSNTRKCTNCGKQYFKFILFSKYIFVSIISIIIAATSTFFVCYNNHNFFKHTLSYCESPVGVGRKHLAYIGKSNTNYNVKVSILNLNGHTDTILNTYKVLSDFDGYINLDLRVTEKGLYKILVYEQNENDSLCTYFTVE